ncbi:MAG: hypothetical protein P4L41_05955 [Flavipsychrobacter sp.]|nr:hypothetical protein [Flavipsychrobacter sp.]
MPLKLYAALLALLPFAAVAQPTVVNREQYPDNAIVHYLYTNTLPAGSAGANQTWNFSTLTADTSRLNDTLTEYVTVPGSAGGPYAGLVQAEKFSDSTEQYIKMNGNNLGISYWADSAVAGYFTNYAHPLAEQIYSMSLGATVSDTVTYTGRNSGMPNSGYDSVMLVVDAYGTLTLPNRTYNNVVRLKEVKNDSQVIPILGLKIIEEEVSYRWYNASYISPLLTSDTAYYKITVAGNPAADTAEYITYTRYLLAEHISIGVSTIPLNHVSFNGHIGNTAVVLTGSFTAGSKYTACIFNMAGQKVYDNTFAGGLHHVSLPLSSNLPPGTYTILVMETGKPETMNTVKTTKE